MQKRHVMNLQIRKAQPSDQKVLNCLVQQSSAYSGVYRQILDGYELTADQIAIDYIYLGELNGCVVGFYSVTLKSDSAELDLMFVANNAQNRGIGAQMIDHMRNLVSDMGLPGITIVSHPPAVGFYMRLGATRIGTKTPIGRVTWERPILYLSLLV
jgi:N-acetylglutamate synthase-like GNAT family acetyltransferase